MQRGRRGRVFAVDEDDVRLFFRHGDRLENVPDHGTLREVPVRNIEAALPERGEKLYLYPHK